jgi:flagellar motor switch/type III secretory pathway protein FliN
MYMNDPFLDDLLRKPLLMASLDDEDDEEEEEEDLFSDDLLQSVIADREAEQEEAEAFAASLRGDQSPQEEAPVEEAIPQPPQKLFTRPGIRRNPIGYMIFTLSGLIPLVMLIILMAAQKGLSGFMSVFLVLFLVGLGISFYNVIYNLKHGYEFTVSFNLRSFFRFWPEVAVIGAVLIGISFWNLAGLTKGRPLTLSGNPIQQTQTHQTSNMMLDGTENEEQASAFQVAQNKSQPGKRVTPAGGAVGIVGAQDVPGEKYNRLFEEPVAGGGAGYIGSRNVPENMLPKTTGTAKDMLSGNPVVDQFFFGGALCAAFGYALILAIAGGLFGALRPFETPFSQKYVEIINIETGEVTADKQPIAPIMKPLNIAARILIGFTYGGTLGFLLGVAIVLPLLMLFGNQMNNPNVAPLLSSLGVVNIPDLAFTNAITLAGLMVPLIIGLVAKMSPAGMSISEELMRSHYEIRPTGRFVSADATVGAGGSIPEPAIIRFGPDVSDDELDTTHLVEELAMDEDNLTTEIVDEFGRELEQVFGIDTRELMGRQTQRQTVDKRRLAEALDESFGELGNVPVEISAELGKATIPVTDWLNLQEGTLILLDKPATEEIDILFNGVSKGKGKLIVVDNALSVKVSHTNIHSGNGHQAHGLLI